MRTPPLKKLPTNVFLSWAEVGPGKFGCRLCAPKRPPRLHSAETSCGTGAVPTMIGFVSSRMSTIQISFGASAHFSLTASSETVASPRLKSGWNGWVQAGAGGEVLGGAGGPRGKPRPTPRPHLRKPRDVERDRSCIHVADVGAV